MDKTYRTLLSFGAVMLCIEADATCIRRVFRVTAKRPEEQPNPVTERAKTELEQFFAGERERFTVPIRPEGTAFQKRVWQALREIPYGGTRSYAEIAEAAGNPSAAHAAGQAIGANPILILIPCHRVIRADGTIGGFSSGLDLKRKLLQLEKRQK